MSDVPVLGGLHQMDDLATADDFTKKHTPFIDASRDGDIVTVAVAVGHYVSHPNTSDHFFEYIEFKVGGVTLARFDLSAVACEPKVTAALRLEADTILTAAASCNLHGVWVAEVKV